MNNFKIKKNLLIFKELPLWSSTPAATATDRGTTVSTPSRQATRTVPQPVWTQRLETAEMQRLSANVSDARNNNSLHSSWLKSHLNVCYASNVLSSAGRGHKSWGSTVSDDSVVGEGALESPTASTSESELMCSSCNRVTETYSRESYSWFMFLSLMLPKTPCFWE